MWSLAPEFKTKVQENWEKRSEGRHMFKVVGKLNRLRKVLKTLNRNRFSEMETRADLAMEKLRQCQDRIQLNPLNMDLYMEENKLSQEARLLEKAKFQFLRQKSKMQWLKEGDQNTKFFHNYLKARRSNNRIFTIKDTNGVQHTSIDNVKSCRKHVCSDIIQQGTLVNEAQRDELTREFTKEEVKQALWAIDGNKSPGLDGYGSKFFKNCWGIVGEDVTKGILEYFQNGEMLRWKLTAVDCEMLVDKLVSKIQIWGTRNLSYAGITQLLNSVLLHIHTYWSSIFLLPKKVLRNTTTICRNFLWSGQGNTLKSPLIAWKEVCMSKK
ncbi:hypothetical protein H5410_041999 [Solanum commersonii]|uniref:Reverse transcriptase n=1 Tax=Solanum commersonii TaxID=4109 RepID=A0A9J5XUH3_SOLCO|nr:hypothetical protein H5410_041999 [Solanum commersonii]